MTSSIVVEATLEKMETVHDFIRDHMKGCPEKTVNQMMIAADEIFSNIARYAYPSKSGTVEVRIAIGDDVLIEFEDSGIAFDPLSEEDPDVMLAADERKIGGLGIYMVKNIMDSVTYRRVENNNILRIKKRVEKT